MTREEILKKLRTEWELCLDDWDLPLTEDKEFILTLLDEHQGSGDEPSALRNASESLKNDKNFIIQAMNANGRALLDVNENFLKDKEIVLAAVSSNGLALQFADDSLKKDKEVALAAVECDGYALNCVDESLKKDREVVMAAVEQNGTKYVLELADQSLQNDPDILALLE